MIEWISELTVTPSSSIIEIARHFAFDDAQPYFLKFICMKMVGDYGTIADLERLEESYGNAKNYLEQSIIMCCLVRMEKGRRNAFLGRAEKDCELNKRASKLVKSTAP
jgi:hypothetical protein